MEYETIKIEKITGSCPACEEYSKKHTTDPPKIAVMACDGACAKGEVARRAANLVAYHLARDDTVRICLGGAFTKDGGQRELVRRSSPAIAIEGCFLFCSSRMMKGALPGLEPVIVQADMYYDNDLPFGSDETTEEELRECARIVAEGVVRDYLAGQASTEAGAYKKKLVPVPSGAGKAGCCKPR
jgi:uncharacterized metal-binding protein